MSIAAHMFNRTAFSKVNVITMFFSPILRRFFCLFHCKDWPSKELQMNSELQHLLGTKYIKKVVVFCFNIYVTLATDYHLSKCSPNGTQLHVSKFGMINDITL